MIRSKQMDALRLDLMERFEERMVRLATKRFPEQAAQIGPSALPPFIRQSIADAHALSLNQDSAISFYVLLTVAFQPDFLRRKETRWMADFLVDETTAPLTRVELLYEAMREDPACDFFVRALHGSDSHGH
jgi:hypothetical protein